MAPKIVFPSRATVAAEMSRVPQYGNVNINVLVSAPVKYRQNVVEIPLSTIIEESPFQTRRKFDPETFEEDRLLVESIQALGQWEPICVQSIVQGKYRIVYGHRRIAALRCLKAEKALAIIIQGNPTEIATWTAIENSGVPLSSLEKAELARHLFTELEMTTADIAIRIGDTQRHVQRLLRVADAAEAVRLALTQEAISIKIAYEVALAPMSHQGRLVEIAIACRLQHTDCAAIVKILADENSSPDEAALAYGFLPSGDANQPKVLDANDVPPNGSRTDAEVDARDNSETEDDSVNRNTDDLQEKSFSLSENGRSAASKTPPRAAQAKFDPAATCKMLQNEMTTVDKGVVRTIVARSVDRKFNQRDLRVAVLLAAAITPAKALDNAESLTKDPAARLLAQVAQNIGRLRSRVQRGQHNEWTTAMLQALVKECQSLAAESKAMKQ